MKKKPGSEARMNRLLLNGRKKLSPIKDEIAKHLDIGWDPLPKTNAILKAERAHLKALKTRFSRNSDEMIKSLIQQQISAQNLYINQLMKMRQKIYNSHR